MEKWIIIEEENEEGGVPQEREIHRGDDVILRSGPWHARESLQKKMCPFYRKDAVLLYLPDHFD